VTALAAADRWRRGARHVALVAGVLAAAACASPRVRAGVDPCTGPGADTTGWQVVDAGPLQLSLPAPYEREEVRGIDSFVGHWVAPGQRLVAFDFGMYSNSLNDASTSLVDYRECRTEIGGWPVKVVSGYDERGRWHIEGKKYVVSAAWRDVHGGSHLTLSATSAEASDLPSLLSIVRSVRFKGLEQR
jgi:hypothetical protein